MSEKPITEIVDTAAAAAHLSLAPITLAKMRIAGGGPRYLKFGRAVRYLSLPKTISARSDGEVRLAQH